MSVVRFFSVPASVRGNFARVECNRWAPQGGVLGVGYWRLLFRVTHASVRFHVALTSWCLPGESQVAVIRAAIYCC